MRLNLSRLATYIVIGSWLLALMNWKTVQYTRITHPEYTEWMHSKEQTYKIFTDAYSYIVCPPCAFFEPIFYAALKHVQASAEQQAWITHAPEPDLHGFYHSVKRGDSWTFVSWIAWGLYWLPISLIWWKFVGRFFDSNRRKL